MIVAQCPSSKVGFAVVFVSTLISIFTQTISGDYITDGLQVKRIDPAKKGLEPGHNSDLGKNYDWLLPDLKARDLKFMFVND